MVEYESAKTLNVACPMSDGQAAFGVFFLRRTEECIRQWDNKSGNAFYLMSQEKILAIHSRRPGLGGLCLSPGMMWWGIDG